MNKASFFVAAGLRKAETSVVQVFETSQSQKWAALCAAHFGRRVTFRHEIRIRGRLPAVGSDSTETE